MQNATEEGQKVNMKGGNKYFCVYEKIDIR